MNQLINLKTTSLAVRTLVSPAPAQSGFLTREKLVVGTTSLEAIAQDKEGEKCRTSDKSRWLTTLGCLLIPLAFGVAKIGRFISRLGRSAGRPAARRH
jgi:hypothetical protein